MNKDNSELSFSEAPIEFQLKHYQRNEKSYLKEIEKLKKEPSKLKEEIQKMLEFQRGERQCFAEKIAVPLTQKESKKYFMKFMKERGIWSHYCMWLLKEKGYVKE